MEMILENLKGLLQYKKDLEEDLRLTGVNLSIIQDHEKQVIKNIEDNEERIKNVLKQLFDLLERE